MCTAQEMNNWAKTLSTRLLARNMKIATVESCTGGSVAALFTDIPGSSEWFECGYVTYSNISKTEMVGVRSGTITAFGAVSEQVASEMATGGVEYSRANCAISITGVAGPDGGSEAKPVGMVCFGWAGFSDLPHTKVKYFHGDRQAVRTQSVCFAVQEAAKLLKIE